MAPVVGYIMCHDAEQFKAWSQNLGHEDVLTTLRCYGQVADHRQGEIMQGLAIQQLAVQSDVRELAKALAREMHDPGVKTPVK